MSENTQSTEAVVVERTFDAPIELIWQLWTNPADFQQWYGPVGFSVPVAEMDVRVGGKRLVCMEMPTDGDPMRMWTVGEFTALEKPHRLAYTESPSDAEGNIVTDSNMPTNTLVTVVLEAIETGTKMTLTHAGLPANAGGASDGWQQAFNKLADYAESLAD
ncbi:MAG: SRPBCC domain-containing protein, partial [Chloroflexota bacterium]